MTVQKNAFLPSVSMGVALTISLGLAGCSTTHSSVVQPVNVANTVATNSTPVTPVNAPNERERMLASLNLTEAQKSQLEALRLQNRPKMQALQAQLKQYNATLSQPQAGTNEATLLNLYQQKHAVTLQEAELHRQYEQRFLAILTPSQQIQYYQTLPENKKP